MGAYGSPDTGSLYSNNNYDDNRKPKFKRVNSILLFVIIALDIFIISITGFNMINILGVIALDSIIILIYSVIGIIYNLVTRNKISKYLKLITACVFLLIFSSIAMSKFDYVNHDVSNKVVNNKSSINESNNNEQLGKRLSPAKLGQIVTVGAESSNGSNCILEIELVEVLKGEDALIMSKNITDYIGPGENKQYAFAKFRIKNVKNNSTKDLPFPLNSAYFNYATSNYKKYNDWINAFGLDPDITADLYEGAEHIGWVTLYVEKDDPKPKVVFLGGEGVWFDL